MPAYVNSVIAHATSTVTTRGLTTEPCQPSSWNYADGPTEQFGNNRKKVTKAHAKRRRELAKASRRKNRK